VELAQRGIAVGFLNKEGMPPVRVRLDFRGCHVDRLLDDTKFAGLWVMTKDAWYQLLKPAAEYVSFFKPVALRTLRFLCAFKELQDRGDRTVDELIASNPNLKDLRRHVEENPKLFVENVKGYPFKLFVQSVVRCGILDCAGLHLNEIADCGRIVVWGLAPSRKRRASKRDKRCSCLPLDRELIRPVQRRRCETRQLPSLHPNHLPNQSLRRLITAVRIPGQARLRRRQQHRPAAALKPRMLRNLHPRRSMPASKPHLYTSCQQRQRSKLQRRNQKLPRMHQLRKEREARASR